MALCGHHAYIGNELYNHLTVQLRKLFMAITLVSGREWAHSEYLLNEHEKPKLLEVSSFSESIDTGWPIPPPKCYSLIGTGVWLVKDWKYRRVWE